MQTSWLIQAHDGGDGMWYSLEVTVPGKTRHMLASLCTVEDLVPNSIIELRIKRIHGRTRGDQVVAAKDPIP